MTAKPKKSVDNTCWFVVSSSYIDGFIYKSAHLDKESAAFEIVSKYICLGYVIDSRQYIYLDEFDTFFNKNRILLQFSFYIVEREVVEVPIQDVYFSPFHLFPIKYMDDTKFVCLL